jgi:hypothetical protein
MILLMTAAMAANVHFLNLDCQLEPGNNISIYLVGKKPNHWDWVTFEDSSNVLGDDYGTKSPNERKWRIRSDKDGGIILSSVSNRVGHSAKIELWAESGRLTGYYWANQGMMSEGFSAGTMGEISCVISPV